MLNNNNSVNKISTKQENEEMQRRMSVNIGNEQLEILEGRERSKTLINPCRPLNADMLTPDGKMLINFGVKLRTILSTDKQKQKLTVPKAIRNCKSFDDVIETDKLNNNIEGNEKRKTEILERKGGEPSSSTSPLFPSPFSKIFRLRAKSDVNCNKREGIYKDNNN
ncbi:hypothetical protein ACQ4LE_001139 [Meloidogyne hapla]|uniref:Uncharacterized protein n=1 Tax=Meloidogyne hapla TaxID=6305 RepID=A0A1I8B4N0_MELHA